MPQLYTTVVSEALQLLKELLNKRSTSLVWPWTAFAWALDELIADRVPTGPATVPSEE